MSNRCHEILVINVHPSGAEEWLCPTCGRRFVVQWSPDFQCTVLSVGDSHAIHNLSRGALVVAAPEPHLSDESLAPWLKWLQSIDVDRALGIETTFD